MTQYIKTVSIENANFIQLATSESEPELNVDIAVKVDPIGEGVFETTLRVISKVSSNKKDMFSLSLEYAAVVKIEEQDESVIKKTLLVNIPTLLFPFARAIVSDLTRDSGHPPLMLMPVDFEEMYNKNESKN